MNRFGFRKRSSEKQPSVWTDLRLAYFCKCFHLLPWGLVDLTTVLYPGEGKVEVAELRFFRFYPYSPMCVLLPVKCGVLRIASRACSRERFSRVSFRRVLEVIYVWLLPPALQGSVEELRCSVANFVKPSTPQFGTFQCSVKDRSSSRKVDFGRNPLCGSSDFDGR